MYLLTRTFVSFENHTTAIIWETYLYIYLQEGLKTKLTVLAFTTICSYITCVPETNLVLGNGKS